MMDVVIRVLPQVHRRFHIDEAGVLAELPVRVVGDPPLSVIGINHFPEGTDRWDSCKKKVSSPRNRGMIRQVISRLVNMPGIRCINDACAKTKR